MLMNLKQWLWENKGPEYDQAQPFGNVRLGAGRLFWKNGMKLCALELRTVRRVWRQEENVYGKLCCGGRSYVIHRLVLQLEDGRELTVHIGDDAKAAALALLDALREQFPHIAIGNA